MARPKYIFRHLNGQIGRRTVGQIKRARRVLLKPELWLVRVTFWVGALAVGGVAAFFAVSAAYADRLFYGLARSHPFVPLFITPLGFVVAAWLTGRYFRGAEGSGIPQTIVAVHDRDETVRQGLLSLRIAAGKILVTLIGLFSGASIGREGPTVHIGASIMHSLGRWVPFPSHDLDRGLILAGGAAGLAAAFNTPLAGIVFAIEEMGRGFEERTSGTILTAVLISGLATIALLGNYSYFGISTATLATGTAWLAVAVCGLAGGVAGGAFSRILVWGGERLSPLRGAHPLLFALSCGLAVAVLGVLSGGSSFGTGYIEASAIVTGHTHMAADYPWFKFLSTMVSYLSGIPGGLFAPSLATGAGIGAVLSHWVISAPASAVAILGMVGYLSGVTRAPITSFVIVMEMTSDHRMILPLIATAFLASQVSRLANKEPVYRELAMGLMRGRQRQAGES